MTVVFATMQEDTVEIRDKSKSLALIDIALANKEREVPEYLQLDEKNQDVMKNNWNRFSSRG